MPLLFSLGQHRALVAVNDELQEGERLMAFLDDIYVSTPPDRTGTRTQRRESMCTPRQAFVCTRDDQDLEFPR